MKTITAIYRSNTTTIEIDTIAESNLTDGQSEKAKDFGATHVFTTKDCMDLPKYVHQSLIDAGLNYVKIGHTSYKSATWGAKIVA